MWYYSSKKDDTEVIEKLQEYAQKHPTRSFEEYYGKIRNKGIEWNRKRVLGVYRSLHMKLRRKSRGRIPARIKDPLLVPMTLNDTGCIDFMSDALVNGRRIRIFNAIDDASRESLSVYANFSISGDRVVEALSEIVQERGYPRMIRVDNGPEFISKVFTKWCYKNGIQIKNIQPGKPMQNAYIERFNRLFSEDVLNAHLFESLDQVRMIAETWMDDYNHLHPYKSLDGRTLKQTADLLLGACPKQKRVENKYISTLS